MSKQKPNTTGICEHCGTTFRFIYRSNRPHPYCSLQCFHTAKLANAPDTSKLGYQQTADGQWWYVWASNYTRAQERECLWCGDPFIGHGKRRRYCSRSCRSKHLSPLVTPRGADSPHWKGGVRTPRHGGDWMRQRRLALERDGYSCRECGISESDSLRPLDVHHIKPYKDFPSDRPDLAHELSNLISLCRWCHIRHERSGNG